MASEATPKKIVQPYTEEQRRRLSELLRSWTECDEEEAEEQRETYEFLKKALDKKYSFSRKLLSESAAALEREQKTYTPEQKRRIHETLMSFLEGDEEDAREQQETLEFLKKALDENRHSARKLFATHTK